MKFARDHIQRGNLPRSLNLTFYAVVWLLMDRFDVHGWAAGVTWTLVALLFVAHVLDWCQSVAGESIDVLKERK